MRESLLHDSELGAGSTRVARLAVGQAPGGRAWSCMHWDLPACLPAAVRQRAARAAMPGMHWGLPACLAACMPACMYGDSEVYAWLWPPAPAAPPRPPPAATRAAARIGR